MAARNSPKVMFAVNKVNVTVVTLTMCSSLASDDMQT